MIYILFFAFIFFRNDFYQSSLLLRVFERGALAVVCLFILEQVYSSKSLWKFGRSRLVSYLGRISYGLYVLHFLGILIATNATKLLGLNTKLWQVLFLETLLALLLTILMSHISYIIFERRFLRIKDKFSLISK